MSAKQLCAQLVTRALQDLTEEEEEVVVDYLESARISVDLDANPRELCTLLLEKTMQKDIGRRVPMTAYANSLLGKSQAQTRKVDMTKTRQQKERLLEKEHSQLPGCQLSPVQIPKTLYELKVDPDLGIMELSTGESQYTSMVSLPMNLYEKVFSAETSPVLEIVTDRGERGYARIGEPHSESDTTIYVSPLIGTMLNITKRSGAFIKLCSSLPIINHIDFTFYGDQKELDGVLGQLIVKLPEVIEAFSYLSLGMVLNSQIGDKMVKVRVDGLTDANNRIIFAGLIPFGISDIAFDVSPDVE